MTSAVILIAVLATATLSGVLGMAGGIVLMAVLIATLPVAGAMVVHGAAQAASNGARFVFLRDYMMWRTLPPYAAGAALAVALFAVFAFVPHPGLVLILVGATPWLARWMPALKGLDIRRPPTAAICGATVTATQLLAGASGPLLDAFYQNTDVDRRAIVATKAFTQTVGHLLKLVYYALIVGQLLEDVDASAMPLWLIGAVVALAVVGTRIGTQLLGGIDDRQFRRVSGWAILTLGALCMAKGVRDLLVQSAMLAP